MQNPVLQLKDGQTYVDGRSEETSRKLIELAEAAGLTNEVYTTSFGYIVPTSILPVDGVDETDEDKGEEIPETPGDKTVADQDSDPAAGEEEDLGEAAQFDPTQATIAEVKEYLDAADEDERERVLAAEAASEKPRKGVTDLAVTSEGAK